MRRAGMALLLLLGGAGASQAQVSDTRGGAGATLGALGVRPGRTVRVAIPGEGRVAGQVTASGDGGFTLATPGGERPFAALPDTLWTRRRAVVPGVLVGGIAGVGAGALLGLFANAICEYECGSAAGDAAAGALIVGAGGAALGALVGAAIPRWQRRAP